MQDASQIRLRAFVGRSFLEADKHVWHELRDLLDALRSLGFEYEDAKEAQVRPISEKVRALINRNDIYIGMLTQRHLIDSTQGRFGLRVKALFESASANLWTASEWIIEEIGYAIGKEKPVILLVEDGVVFPTTDLDADTQWIPFKRDKLTHSQTELTQMIANLIAKRITTLRPISPTAVEDITPEDSQQTREPSKATFGERLDAFRNALSSGRYAEADRIQAEIISEETDIEDKTMPQTYFLGERAEHGDGIALQALKKRVEDNPSNLFALLTLYETYASFKQYDSAIDLLRGRIAHIEPGEHTIVTCRLASALRKNGKTQEAIEVILARLPNESDEPKRLSLYREIADAAQDQKDNDLEAAYREKVLQLNPADNEVRFRLAFLYGDSQRNNLAAYHYNLITTRVDWPNANNNLAVAYGALGLKASKIEQLLKAVDKNSLAKANIANLYADAGFLSQAEQLARGVLAASDDDIASARARHALDESAALREKEATTIDTIENETREEREFMVTFADAFLDAPPNDFVTTFITPHGDIEMRKKQGNLYGTGTFTRHVSPGALSTLAMGLRSASAGHAIERTYQLNLVGTCRGKTAVFELKISIPDDPGTFLTPSTRILTGLIVFRDDGRSFRALAREDKKTTFFLANRTE